jgi:hypothetical protein
MNEKGKIEEDGLISIKQRFNAMLKEYKKYYVLYNLNPSIELNKQQMDMAKQEMYKINMELEKKVREYEKRINESVNVSKSNNEELLKEKTRLKELKNESYYNASDQMLLDSDKKYKEQYAMNVQMLINIGIMLWLLWRLNNLH